MINDASLGNILRQYKSDSITEEEAIKLEEEGKNNFLVLPPSKTKEQIIRALKFSVNSLEQKLSNVLISENNLRQEIQKLKKENNYYYEFYKLNKSSNYNNTKDNDNYNINTHKAHNNKKNPFNNFKRDIKNQHLKHNTKDNFFNKSKEIILINDSHNNNILGNDHKRNNSENDNRTCQVA